MMHSKGQFEDVEKVVDEYFENKPSMFPKQI